MADVATESSSQQSATASETARGAGGAGGAGGASGAKRGWREYRIVATAAASCILLAIVFSTISYRAAMTKSASYDEPLHVVGGFVHHYFHDYRINPEDPALFGFWAALPLRQASLLTDVTSNKFQLAASDIRQQWPFVITAMFQTPNSDGGAALDSSRAMFTLLGAVLIVLVSYWGWRLAGGSFKPVGDSKLDRRRQIAAASGAIVTAALLAFDPNFLAHASIVKNDVPLALLMCGIAYTVWQLGRYGSWWRLLLLSLLVGAAVNVKFSALLLAPIIALMLLARAVLPAAIGRVRDVSGANESERDAWHVFGVDLTTLATRVVAAFGVCFVIATVSFAMTWAVYGFRFSATRDGTPLNFQNFQDLARYNEIVAELLSQESRDRPTDVQFNAHPLGGFPRAIEWLRTRKMLPEGWLFGLTYTYATTLIRGSFLLGETKLIGWRSYFPLAMLFKTPVSILIASFGALIVGIATLAVPRVASDMSTDRDRQASADANAPGAAGFDWWVVICVGVPPLVYMLAALTTNLNLGVRHVLPVYPFIYLAIGAVVARATYASLKLTSIVTGAIILMLMIETMSAYPNYLAYFNFPSGGSLGGIKKLGDSNLDWGQDLKLLAEWQKTHRDRPLYTAYFGSADPAYYGVDAGNLTARYPFRPVVAVPADRPVYLAISATELQNIYAAADDYVRLRGATPVDILGGTIYIYKWPEAAFETAENAAKEAANETKAAK